MKIIAWNINGIRAQIKKNDLFQLIDTQKPDIICFGETKVSCPFIDVQDTLKTKIKKYPYRYWSPCTIKSGYSGTAIFSNIKPISIFFGINKPGYEDEGRVITLEFDNFFLIHVYTPNSGQELARLNYRVQQWDKYFRRYTRKLQKTKPIIICGDLNVAHQNIDIHNPKTNKRSAGFTIEERNSFQKLLDKNKLIDTFRFLNPSTIKYSYWTYYRKARENNKGWRIDYFLVSKSIINLVSKSDILTNIMGSDHAPIILKINL